MSDPKLIQNRYQLIDQLGQGGMGIVYKALDRLTGEQVALKQLQISADELDFASKAKTDDTDKLRLALANEFSILATLRHPHILSVLDFGFDEAGLPYYTMTLLEGARNFRDYALTQPEYTRYDLILQTLQALHYLHRRGMLHRDLKPDNVFVMPDGQVKVMDFGLAKKYQGLSSSQSSGALFGTLRYMAPELMSGKKASVAYDLYALGVMAYEVLLEKYPYAYNTVAQLMLQVLRQPVDCSALPPQLDAWLTGLLAKDPSERPASAYDAMLGLYDALDIAAPPDDQTIRESFLQASTFVGRDAELKQLTDALDTLQADCAFFLIGGESGVGKSRLLDELRIQALVKGFTVLRGQAVEGGGLPFQLWRGIVRRLLLMVEVNDLQAGILKDIVPDVSELIGREVPDAPKLTGGVYLQRIVLTAVDLLRDLPHPILILLEDLQWTVESLDLLKQILLVREQLAKLMIVASYRNDEAPNLPKTLVGMTSLKLERLSEQLVGDLSTAMLGNAGADEEVIRLLHQESEGNIFFVVETVRALAEESGGLQQISRNTLTDGILTGGMQQLMQRRLNAVDSQFTEIQSLAAIIGRIVDTQLLAHVHRQNIVSNWLQDAAEHGVLDVQGNTWRFAHDKLRETVLANISAAERPALHRHVAVAIEAVYPGDEAYNEALLVHWGATDDLDKTYQYLLPVAKNMIETKGAYAIAEAHLHRMLERLNKDDERCIALWNWLTRGAQRQGNYEAGQRYAEQAKQLATTLDNRAELALSLNNLGMIAMAQGDFAGAAEHNQQSMALRQSLNDQRGIAVNLNDLGGIAMAQGDLARAAELTQQSVALAQQLGDQRSIAMSLHNLATIAYHDGDFARATDLYQQSLVLSQQLSFQLLICHNYTNLGWLALKQGDGQASNWFGQALRIAYSIHAIPETLWAVVSIAGVLIQGGAGERAAQYAGLVQFHHGQDSNVHEALALIMAQLEASLSLEDLKAALEHGKTHDLDTVVQALLKEFGAGEIHVAKPEGKRSSSLDAILVAALAQLNAASPDETIISVEAARQKLSAAQVAKLEAKLHAIEASATGEDTIELGDIINAVVTMLRDSNDM